MTKRKWNPNKDRLKELETMVIEYAKGKGFENLRDSFSGTALAISSLAGHLLMFDDSLTSDEWIGIVIAAKLAETLGDSKK